MSAAPPVPWTEANQRYLLEALASVRSALERHVARTRGKQPGAADSSSHSAALSQVGNVTATSGDSQDTAPFEELHPALQTLCRTFNLSPFERGLLLLCAGMELDPSFAALCASAQADPMRAYPTLSLALAVLPDPHWSALTPSAPLRYWRLIEVGAGSALTLSPLRIDERVLHYLAGVQHMDERLVSVLIPAEPPGDMVPSHLRLAEQLAAAWRRNQSGPLPPVQLCGIDAEAKRAIAAATCTAFGLHLYVMHADTIPTASAELENLVRLWMREVALGATALLLDCEGVDAADSPRMQAVATLIERTAGPLILMSRDRWRTRNRRLLVFDVHRPTQDEQRALWQGTLDATGASLNGQVDPLVAQFDLSAQTIQAVSASLSQTAEGGAREIHSLVWDTCRMQARPRLDDLAQRLELSAGWDDLVLPEAQHQTLREIVAQVRERSTVYETWGFRSKGSRGLGISALFAGSSGTGKTTAAEVLANELRLDLYRIDLSSVVSKYIGETEKNLRRVFDAAEEGGAVLLFDEADALFGKRTEVKDSHDRYANIEVSYLLQRMEAYRGLAILTTNMKKALDSAFLRRIRFVVQFPFPDAPQRAEIWRRIFPSSTPTEKLDVDKLAQLNVAGGSIRNIALYAAFLAADARQPVRMSHLLRAAQREYAKLEKPLTGSEMEGWE